MDWGRQARNGWRQEWTGEEGGPVMDWGRGRTSNGLGKREGQ